MVLIETGQKCRASFTICNMHMLIVIMLLKIEHIINKEIHSEIQTPFV